MAALADSDGSKIKSAVAHNSKNLKKKYAKTKASIKQPQNKVLEKQKNEISQTLIENYKIMRPQVNEQFDTKKIIPLSLSPTRDQDLITKQVADQTLKTIWDETGIKKTKVGKALEVVEQKLNTEIKIAESSTSVKDKVIEHKINFEVKALQNIATIKYQGFGEVLLGYEAPVSQTTVSVSQNISDNKSLVLRQRWLPTDRFSEMYVQWNF
jgi:hypothetical protein